MNSGENFETACHLLRQFKKEQWQKLEHTPPPFLFEHLTVVAEQTLTMAVTYAQAELQQSNPKYPFTILAMGKFGGQELTYGSDLDLIFIFEPVEAQEFFSRLVQKIIALLGTITAEGYAYKIDMDLRPSGRSGVLVSSLQSFQEYHQTTAQLWEQQALLKARPVAGPPEFCHRIKQLINSIVYQERPATIGQEINRLRHRMEREIGREFLQQKNCRYDIKVGYGGLVDIEFLAQYLQLRHGWNYPTLQTTQTLAALQGAVPLYLSPDEAKKLSEAYLFYRELETRLRQATGLSTSVIFEGSRLMTELEGRYFSHLHGKLMDNFKNTRNYVRGAYHRVLGNDGCH